MFRRKFFWFSAVLLGCLAGCTKYQAQPLASQQIVMNVEAARRKQGGTNSGDAPPPFTFSYAVELMSANSPALREARSEYQTAMVLTKVKTPLPNPTFEAGPRYGFGPDVMNVNPYIPFGSLGFTIPTGKRLKRQDELNQVLAEVAYVEAQVKHRELYMELRKLY